jgi:pyridoxamine 5'-phosphate oxidase
MFEPPPGVADLRRNYTRAALVESSVDPDPMRQFARWLDDAIAAALPEPNAMVLATVSEPGQPSARTVLLKGYDEHGFVFFTNYNSAKGRDLAVNPRAALLFPWHPLERQVAVTGTAARVGRAESVAYFTSRPRGSQLGAWASPQSTVVAGRAELDAALDRARASYPDDVPVPEHWGGFRVRPNTVEFWQGRPDRMHDRLRYRRDDAPAGAGWVVERLAP